MICLAVYFFQIVLGYFEIMKSEIWPDLEVSVNSALQNFTLNEAKVKVKLRFSAPSAGIAEIAKR